MASITSPNNIPEPSRGTPTQLLAIQGFLGGFILAMLFAVANTLFLKDYGPDWFPLMYIYTAIAIPAVTLIYKQVSDRSTVNKLLIGTSSSLFVVYLIVWGLTLIPGQKWMSFALMVFFGVAFIYQLITIPVQASYLFDLRQIKSQMPILLASQVAALIVSGLLIGLLTSLLGGVSNLLLICMVLSGAQAYATWHTVNKFSNSFKKSTSSLTAKSEATWGEALKNKFGRYIFFYRYFSFFGTEMIVLLLATYAARLFKTEQELASLFGNTMAVGTFLTLLFLVLVSGRMLKRYGLGFGLLINPIIVVIPIVAIGILSLFGVMSERMILGIVITSRIADFILSAGASNPSVQTMFQALPERVRPILVTISESLVLPLCYLSLGLILYIFRWLDIYTDMTIIIFSIIICILWTLFSFLTYRSYVSALLSKLQRVGIGEAELSFDDPHSHAVIMTLAKGDNLRTSRMALDMLKKSEHSDYGTAVLSTLNSPSLTTQLDALQRLESLPEHANHDKVMILAVKAGEPAIRAAALTTYTASGDEAAFAVANNALHHSDYQIRRGALVGLLKYGGLAGQVTAAQQLMSLLGSDKLEEKLLLAKTLANAGKHNFYQPVADLLEDEAYQVRREALKAVHNAPNPSLMPKVVAQLAHGKTRSAAADALEIYGLALRPEIEKGLAIPSLAHARLVQLSGGLPSGDHLGIATDLLVPHLQHPSAMMREAVRNALYRANVEAKTADFQHPLKTAISDDIARIGTLFGLKAVLLESDAYPQVLSALADEIDHKTNALLDLVSLETGGRQLRHLARTLKFGDSQTVAQAIEGIDVLLPTERKRTILPLIDSELSFAKQTAAIQKQIELPEFTVETALQHILLNEGDHHDDYTVAAAVYDIAQQNDNRLPTSFKPTEPAAGSLAHETLTWATTTTGDYPMLAIEKIAILKQTDIWGSVPEGALAAVAQIAAVLELPANETFIYEGASAEEMFVIVAGTVQAQKNGKPIVDLGAGDTVGELAIFDAQPRASNVVTIEPTTLLVIAQDTLRDVMLDRPEINDGIIRTLVRRVRVQGAKATENKD